MNGPARVRQRPRVLVLAADFPTAELPIRGLWVERLVRAAAADCEPTVLVPRPLFGGWRSRRDDLLARRPAAPAAAAVHRVRTPPALPAALDGLAAALAAPVVARAADQLHRQRPFDLLHAHLVHPDGVLAARLGRRWGVPVVVSEHANWRPWLDVRRAVRRRVLAALPSIRLVTAPSAATAATLREVAGELVTVARLPIPVDDTVFDLDPRAAIDSDRLLFVGIVRHVKGLDVLLRALARLLPERPRLRLEVVGATYLGGHRRDEAAARSLVGRLGLEDRVRFVGALAPAAVAERMRSSAVLVLPSRRESFGSVLTEALACGTPVVATRCGGPEEIVSPAHGELVAAEDPDALAFAIARVLERRASFDPAALRRSAVERFGMQPTRRRLRSIYAALLAGEIVRDVW